MRYMGSLIAAILFFLYHTIEAQNVNKNVKGSMAIVLPIANIDSNITETDVAIDIRVNDIIIGEKLFGGKTRSLSGIDLRPFLKSGENSISIQIEKRNPSINVNSGELKVEIYEGLEGKVPNEGVLLLKTSLNLSAKSVFPLSELKTFKTTFSPTTAFPWEQTETLNDKLKTSAFDFLNQLCVGLKNKNSASFLDSLMPYFASQSAIPGFPFSPDKQRQRMEMSLKRTFESMAIVPLDSKHFQPIINANGKLMSLRNDDGYPSVRFATAGATDDKSDYRHWWLIPMQIMRVNGKWIIIR